MSARAAEWPDELHASALEQGAALDRIYASEHPAARTRVRFAIEHELCFPGICIAERYVHVAFLAPGVRARLGIESRRGGSGMTAEPQPLRAAPLTRPRAARPFDQADAYRARGWSGTLPLPARAKLPPPGGFTGEYGAWPTTGQVAAWHKDSTRSNIALRLPPVVIGLDVDAYDDHGGADTLAALEATYGPLPATWRSTSRADDPVSGIRLYRVPTGVDGWPNEAGKGIDLIRHAHRYIVCWPSVHPEGGTYRWHRPDGQPAADGELPSLDLPALPPGWLAGLTGQPLAGHEAAVRPPRSSRAERARVAREWLAALPGGEPCAWVGIRAAALDAAIQREEQGAHKGTVEQTYALLRAGEQGHPGVHAVLTSRRAAYVAATAAERGGATIAEAEYDRMVDGGVARILRKPDERAGEGCDCGPGVTISGIQTGELDDHRPDPARGWPAPPERAAFHGLAGEVVDAVREHTEADEVALLGTLLAMFGVVAGDGRATHVGAPQRANLYVALAGASASGRKGTSLSVISVLFDAAYPGWRMLQVPGLGSGEGLVGWLKRREGTEHRALVLETELGRLLHVMTRDGSTLSPVIRNAWDGTAIGRNLARDDWLVTRHHVGLLAHVTPAELRERLTSVDAANGFANRFLWLAVRRTRLVALPASPRELLSPFVGPLHRAISAASDPREMPLTPAARARWEALYAERAGTPHHGLSGALTARSETHTARLALLYALLDRSDVIDTAHLAAAEALAAYAERSVTYLFGDSTGDPLADYIRAFLHDGPATRDELRQETGQRDATRLARAIDLLVDLGVARVGKGTSTGRGGRRPIVVELALEFPQFPQFPPGVPAREQASETARHTRDNDGNCVWRVSAGTPVGNDGNDGNSPEPSSAGDGAERNRGPE